MRRIDPILESKLKEYYGEKAGLILRNLLKPPSEERYRIPGEEVTIRGPNRSITLSAEEILERAKDGRSKFELKRVAGEVFLVAKTIEGKSRRDNELEDLYIDRIGSTRAMLGRSVRGKNIVAPKEAKPGKKYNVSTYRGPFIGIGLLVERPGSSKTALYMQNSPRYLPDLRGSDLHEIAAVHPIPRGPTLSILEEDVEGKEVAIIPAPGDMGLAVLLAKRGAKVSIATTLQGLARRVEKIKKRLGIEINLYKLRPEDLPGEYDLVIVNPISSDIGIRPQPYVKFLGSKVRKFLKIAKKYAEIGLSRLKPKGHMIFVINTVDPRELSASLGEAMKNYIDVAPIDPGLEGIEIKLSNRLYGTLVTRDEGPYFIVSRLAFS